MPDKNPNILLVITDQQRASTLGFLGQTPCSTPNMDRIAREGISFDNAICPSPLCLPSRCSLLTSKYPHQIGAMSNSDTLAAPPVLTDRLRARGYYTAYAGKAHVEPPGAAKAMRDHLKELGLDGLQKATAPPSEQRAISRWFEFAYGQGSYDYSVWCEEQGLPDGWPVSDPDVRTYRKPSMTIPKTKVQDMDPSNTYDAWVTNIALRYLRERPKERPFFLVTGFFGPHPPFLIPEPYYSMYSPEDIPEPPNFGPHPNKPRSNTTSFYHQLWLDHGDKWEAWKKSMAVYWGYVSMMDDLVGRLLKALEDEAVLDNTMVIFVSDHAEMLGSHGLWQKMMPYEEDLRVPMLLRMPGVITPGTRSNAVVSLVDLAPTILSLVGEEVPPDMVGQDLSPAFADGAEFQEDAYRFSEHKPLGEWHRTVEWRLVRGAHFKYVWNEGDLDELYDLQADPYELSNLIDDPLHGEELVRLRGRLHRWMRETSDPLLRSFEQAI